MLRYYNDIPIGKENAIDKETLARKWGGVSEREVRRIISELRAIDNGDDYIIVSFSCGKGFYRTDKYEEIERYRTETIKRARNTFIPLKKINRVLSEKEADNQLEMLCINNLKTARIAAGLTAKEVIAEIQRSDPSFNKITMSMIENNKCFPTALQLSIMSRLYKQTTAELAGVEIIPGDLVSL